MKFNGYVVLSNGQTKLGGDLEGQDSCEKRHHMTNSPTRQDKTANSNESSWQPHV